MRPAAVCAIVGRWSAGEAVPARSLPIRAAPAPRGSPRRRCHISRPPCRTGHAPRQKENQHMIRIVIAVDVVPGHEAEWEEQWRMLREMRGHFPGFRGASLLRDSKEPTRYLSL